MILLWLACTEYPPLPSCESSSSKRVGRRADTPVGVPREIADGVEALGALPVRFTGASALGAVEVEDEVSLAFRARRATLVEYTGETAWARPGSTCPVGPRLEIEGVLTVITAHGLVAESEHASLHAAGPNTEDAWLSVNAPITEPAEPYASLLDQLPCDAGAAGRSMVFHLMGTEPLDGRAPVSVSAVCTTTQFIQSMPFLDGSLDAP